ncbi:mucin-22-like [Latimeria chalumnae]|uniref:mucin-22-like n=1 Tax=Latimeria chalumnae TaxID=7897 RepID=UPI00313EBF1E
MGPYNTGTPAFFYAGILLLTLHFQKSTSSSTSTPTDNSAATTNETWSRASLVTQMTESSSAPGKHPAQTTSHSTHEILSTVTEMNKVSTLVSTLVSTPAQGQTTQSWTTQGSRLERSTTQRTSSDTATPTESPATQSEVTVQNTSTWSTPGIFGAHVELLTSIKQSKESTIFSTFISPTSSQTKEMLLTTTIPSSSRTRPSVLTKWMTSSYRQTSATFPASLQRKKPGEEESPQKLPTNPHDNSDLSTRKASSTDKHLAQTTFHSTHEILSTVTEMNKVSTLVSTPAQGQTTQSWTTQGSRLERSTTQRTSSDTATPTESPATQSKVTVQNTNTWSTPGIPGAHLELLTSIKQSKESTIFSTFISPTSSQTKETLLTTTIPSSSGTRPSVLTKWMTSSYRQTSATFQASLQRKKLGEEESPKKLPTRKDKILSIATLVGANFIIMAMMLFLVFSCRRHLRRPSSQE